VLTRSKILLTRLSNQTGFSFLAPIRLLRRIF
jgi:hypothetical protein